MAHGAMTWTSATWPILATWPPPATTSSLASDAVLVLQASLAARASLAWVWTLRLVRSKFVTTSMNVTKTMEDVWRTLCVSTLMVHFTVARVSQVLWATKTLGALTDQVFVLMALSVTRMLIVSNLLVKLTIFVNVKLVGLEMVNFVVQTEI